MRRQPVTTGARIPEELPVPYSYKFCEDEGVAWQVHLVKLAPAGVSLCRRISHSPNMFTG